jgi:hypothetical protein
MDAIIPPICIQDNPERRYLSRIQDSPETENSSAKIPLRCDLREKELCLVFLAISAGFSEQLFLSRAKS